jgi:hypothetical protein
MEGLHSLNSISDVKGFVGRGVSSDGRSHYPMGSDDQTGPWFIGLWRYYDSGLATDEEKERIRKSSRRNDRSDRFPRLEHASRGAVRKTRHLRGIPL